MGTRVALLHGQEGADALDLTLEAAVSQGLAFGTQSACSHPLSVLILLGTREAGQMENGVVRGEGEKHQSVERPDVNDMRGLHVCGLTFSQRR